MSDKLATFVLLADPQQGNPDEKGRLERCSKLNVALNKLPRTSWPPPNENSLITCTGLIDPKATFIAGDLTQFGGLTNSNEQDHTNQYNPSNYVGGKQLEYLRALYDGWKGMNGVEQLGSYGPIYLGLGNHDLADGDDRHTWEGWNGVKKDKKDAYRYQMWNFITQMYTGYRLKGKIDVGPRWSVPFSYIDTRYDAENWGTYEYKDYSLNYFVDLGPVDVYQLHRYGGDPDYGRRSGIEWLKRTLARRGYTRPVIIVQHFKLEGGTDDGLTNPTPGYDWTLLYTYEQRNHLLEVLLPYNVIAFGVGHWHDASVPFQMMPRFKNRKGTMDSDWKERVVPQFQPGAAMSGNLGVVRVEKSTDQKGGERVTLNYVQGNGLYNDKYISWGYGYSDDLPKPKDLYVRQLQVVYLDQPDENSHETPTLCTDLNRGSSNINDTFGGKAVYIRPLFTTDPNKALTSISVRVTDEYTGGENLAQGTGWGPYRYLERSFEKGPAPITGVFLVRSKTQVTQFPDGMAGITGDINLNRNGGGYLYLVWRTWTGEQGIKF